MTVRSVDGGLKRTVDVIAGATLLLLSLPVLALCWLCIRLISSGPAIFRQPRIGFAGRQFVMLKLRTMQVDADERLARVLESSSEAQEEWRQYRRLRQDPRLVPIIGQWLRRSSLDELPQLVNVVRGDMSLVGPRPLEPEWEAQLPADIRAERARVRPGITGLWQVSGRSDLDIQALGRMDLDYIRTRTLWRDVVILCRTPGAVLSGRGAF